MSCLCLSIDLELMDNWWRPTDISLSMLNQWRIDDVVLLSHLQCRNKHDLGTMGRHLLVEFEPMDNRWRRANISVSIYKQCRIGLVSPVFDSRLLIIWVLVMACPQPISDVEMTSKRCQLSIKRAHADCECNVGPSLQDFQRNYPVLPRVTLETILLNGFPFWVTENYFPLDGGVQCFIS